MSNSGGGGADKYSGMLTTDRRACVRKRPEYVREVLTSVRRLRTVRSLSRPRSLGFVLERLSAISYCSWNGVTAHCFISTQHREEENERGP